MNPYSFTTKLYGNLHNRKHLPFWVLTPMRRFCRWYANKSIPSYFTQNQIVEKTKRSHLVDKRVIVSLTSFPARLDDLWLVVNCMFHQTCPPDKIVLWLSKQEVSSIDHVPDSLKRLQGDCFEIHFVEEALRSHMKYYYALQCFRDENDIVITIDDDIYYPPHVIERLLIGAEAYPKSVIANTVLESAHKNGKIADYKDWPDIFEPGMSKDYFFLGVGGVLYPPNALCPEVFNSSVFLDVCKMADDVWLNAMARLNNTSVYHTVSKDLLMEIDNDNTPRLRLQNVGQNFNDQQIDNVRKYCVENFKTDPFE